MSVAIGERARVNARTVSRFLVGLVGLAAAAALLSACQGSSGGTDRAYWRSMYGDPDTTPPDTGYRTCCRHAGQNSNH